MGKFREGASRVSRGKRKSRIVEKVSPPFPRLCAIWILVSRGKLPETVIKKMGNRVAREDYEWVYTEQPHADRRKEILGELACPLTTFG